MAGRLPEQHRQGKIDRPETTNAHGWTLIRAQSGEQSAERKASHRRT
jgi:hypothetical protein